MLQVLRPSCDFASAFQLNLTVILFYVLFFPPLVCALNSIQGLQTEEKLCTKGPPRPHKHTPASLSIPAPCHFLDSLALLSLALSQAPRRRKAKLQLNPGLKLDAWWDLPLQVRNKTNTAALHPTCGRSGSSLQASAITRPCPTRRAPCPWKARLTLSHHTLI